ncbi:MAG: hypothetical protein IKL10_00040 [Clostridia bacterium]|nr:hypothetical protein [Clostridia bacterium]
MSSFNVKTPDEWKENLYKKTNNKKAVRIRPIIVLAAALAVIICFSGSALAVRVSKAPEYFGSIFLRDSQVANEVYSEKNYYFDSNKDDLTLNCKGIVGDSYSVFILFELKSTGEIIFDENKTYDFENHDQNIPFASGYGKSWACYVIDERTMEINVSLSVPGGSMVGKTVSMYFENIEEYEKNSFNKTDVIECEFSGEIVIDYPNTLNKLKATQNTVDIVGVKFKPLKGKISNLHFDYTLELVDGEEIFAGMSEDNLITGTLTLNYADGTRDDFRIKMPPENPDDASVGSFGKRDKKLHIELSLPEPIFANKVTSVELNGTEIFIK